MEIWRARRANRPRRSLPLCLSVQSLCHLCVRHERQKWAAKVQPWHPPSHPNNTPPHILSLQPCFVIIIPLLPGIPFFFSCASSTFATRPLTCDTFFRFVSRHPLCRYLLVGPNSNQGASQTGRRVGPRPLLDISHVPILPGQRLGR